MTSRRKRRVRRTVLAITAALLVLQYTHVSAASSASRSGTPIRVMTIGDFATRDARNPVWAIAVRARFEGANLKGGVLDGRGRRHPVEVTTCNTAFDPQRAAACADQAVRMHVAAVLGLTSADSATMWPTLQAASIPVIGARINSVVDATSPVSFPLGAGLPGLFTAMPRLLAQSGARNVGVVISDYGSATDALVGYVQDGVARAGLKLGPIEFVPPNTTSLAPAAESVTNGGADGIVGFVGDPSAGKLLRQLGQLNFTGPYVTLASFGTSPLASDPDERQAALLVSEFAPVTSNVPGMARFGFDMDESPAGATLARTEGAVNNWLAAWVFQRVVHRLAKVDATSVLQAMGRLQHLDMGGITPPLSTTSLRADVPRMFNATVAFSRVSAGTPPQPLSSGFVDVFDGHRVP